MTAGTVEQLLTNSVAAGATITAAARTSCIPTANVITLPPNYFDAVGQALRITAWGKISSLITTPGTARFDVAVGAAVAWDSLAILLDSVAAHVDNMWKLVIELQCRAVGATASLIGVGTFTCEDILGVPATAPKGVLTAALPWNTAPGVAGATFDSRIANTLDLFFTQTAATGSLTCQSYYVEDLN